MVEAADVDASYFSACQNLSINSPVRLQICWEQKENIEQICAAPSSPVMEQFMPVA